MYLAGVKVGLERGDAMASGLQDDIRDRALPDALRSLLVQQTEVLETLLRYPQDTVQTIQANGDMPSQGKKRQVDAFVHEVSDQLSVLEDPHPQSKRQFEAFQTMLRRQGNPILTDTVMRVKEGLNAHFVVARQHLDAIISRQLP